MDDLRALLLIIGVLILVVMVWAHRRRSHQSKPQADWRAHAQGSPYERARHFDDADDGPLDGATEASYREEPIQPGLKGIAPAVNDYNEVITLYVRAKGQQVISGPALADAARRAGLSFGEMNIFHRIQEGLEQPVFSMANLVAPGDFNPDDWDSFQTPGVSLFAKLPGPVSALDCWDSILATAIRLTELLDAEILDSNRVLLSRKRIGEMRDKMRELDRETGFLSDAD